MQAGLNILERIQYRANRVCLADGLTSPGLVIPEIGGGSFLFQLFQLCLTVGDVKDNLSFPQDG